MELGSGSKRYVTILAPEMLGKRILKFVLFARVTAS